MSERYDSREINEIANRLDVFSVISQYQPCVKHNGKYWLFHCNNNRDTDASLVVDRQQNFYTCYSCATGGGNALAYLVYEQHMTFSEAAETIVRLSGGNYRPTPTPECLRVINRYKKIFEPRANSLSKRVYGDFDLDYEQKFDGSHMPQEWIDEGIPEYVMREFDVRIDNKSERIVYPLFDADLRFITAKGRTRIKDFKRLGIPKYISYSPIGGGDFFCGYRENAKGIKEKNSIIIFEGIKSVMKAKAWGYDYCVSAETSHVNSDQVKRLLQLNVRNVTIAFDKDKTFQQATSGLDLLRRFTNCYIIIDRENLLGEKESPVDKGADVFRRLYENRIRI